MQKEKVDVLVVGAGGAGLRAAVAAFETDPSLRVAVALKGALGQSGVTATACSDRMAFHATLPYTEPGGDDNWKYHADDVYRIGGKVSDGRLAAIQARRAGEAFAYLDKLGVPFAKTPEGRADQFVTDGSKYARACYTGPTTAVDIHKALVKRIRETKVEIWEETTLVRILKDGETNECAGALLVKGPDESADEPVLVSASAVVLATGGPGRAFGTSVFPEGMTGEAAAAALGAGAELVNLEFIQIGLCNPKTRLACSGTLMRALPRFVDSGGKEFLPGKLPALTPAERQNLVLRKGASWPVSLEEGSHMIDVACSRARAEGPIYLDFARDPDGFDAAQFMKGIQRWRLEAEGLEKGGKAVLASPLARLKVMNPKVVAWFKERDIDLQAGDMIEIAPSVQHFQGGIRIDEAAETAVKGLYACGEAAGGQHGANRPGGNALMDSQVFGLVAGEKAGEKAGGRAAARAKASPAGGPSDAAVGNAECYLDCVRSVPAAEAAGTKKRVAELLDRAALVVRSKDVLGDSLVGVREMALDLPSSGGGTARAGAEALGALEFAEALLEAVNAREESRGPHLRFAAPDAPRPVPRDDSATPYWNRIRRGGDGKLSLTREVPPGLPFDMPVAAE